MDDSADNNIVDGIFDFNETPQPSGQKEFSMQIETDPLVGSGGHDNETTSTADKQVRTDTTASRPSNSERVESALNFFSTQFNLQIDRQGNFVNEPTAEQLSALKEWNLTTSVDGHIMPDQNTFTQKAVLARALMPQVDEHGKMHYLFGKGAGAELTLQGDTNGRNKRLKDVPYRTHDDFEIYAAATDNYGIIPFSNRFISVFGPQEIRPLTSTKAIKDLHEDLLHQTAETVDYGGISFLVPQLELQFIEKFENVNEKVERSLRGRIDAEWIASTFELNKELVHQYLEAYVIVPNINRLDSEDAVAKLSLSRIMDELRQHKTRIGRSPADEQKNLTDYHHSQLQAQAENAGVEDFHELFIEEGILRPNANDILLTNARIKRAQMIENLKAKHQQVDELLAAA